MVRVGGIYTEALAVTFKNIDLISVLKCYKIIIAECRLARSSHLLWEQERKHRRFESCHSDHRD